ncbi:MAG: hypothetical protein ABW185_20165 [Sedimenticola sp.]
MVRAVPAVVVTVVGGLDANMHRRQYAAFADRLQVVLEAKKLKIAVEGAH